MAISFGARKLLKQVWYFLRASFHDPASPVQSSLSVIKKDYQCNLSLLVAGAGIEPATSGL